MPSAQEDGSTACEDLVVLRSVTLGLALLVPAGAIDGLTRALRAVTVDAVERRRLGSAAQLLAATYTWSRALDVAMAQYRTLLQPSPNA